MKITLVLSLLLLAVWAQRAPLAQNFVNDTNEIMYNYTTNYTYLPLPPVYDNFSNFSNFSNFTNSSYQIDPISPINITYPVNESFDLPLDVAAQNVTYLGQAVPGDISNSTEDIENSNTEKSSSSESESDGKEGKKWRKHHRGRHGKHHRRHHKGGKPHHFKFDQNSSKWVWDRESHNGDSGFVDFEQQKEDWGMRRHDNDRHSSHHKKKKVFCGVMMGLTGLLLLAAVVCCCKRCAARRRERRNFYQRRQGEQQQIQLQQQLPNYVQLQNDSSIITIPPVPQQIQNQQMRANPMPVAQVSYPQLQQANNAQPVIIGIPINQQYPQQYIPQQQVYYAQPMPAQQQMQVPQYGYPMLNQNH